MQKKERGMSDFVYLTKTLKFLMVRWNGNSALAVAIHFSILETFFDMQRRVRGQKQKVNMKMLNLINSYSKHMGGVDDHDWLAGLFH
ncbi:hypothetical protein TNCV_2410121 [Trichonephila clavipes]|nr:hypothetical protein TNCV_2410121 [Trichonephila clavipes]